MASDHFVDRSGGQRTTLGELVDIYLREVTDSLKRNHIFNGLAHLDVIDDLLSRQRDLFAA